MELKRGISTSGILFASVSATIGSGWLFGSLYASKMAGPAAILSWLIGAIAIIIIALCFSELSTMFPVSGGMSIFPQLTHGNLVSFMLGWISWLAFIVIVPIEVLAVIQYAANFFPDLMLKDKLTASGYVLAFFLTAFLLLINVTSARFMSKTSFYITIWKIFIPCLLIVLFFYKSSHIENLTSHGFAPNGMHGIFASLSIGGIILAYNGFQPGVALAGETKNPQKSIPIAIIGSMLICMVIYCLLQLAFILAIPPELLGQGWDKLTFPGEAGPFAGLATVIGIAWFGMILYSDALISPFGSGIVFMASSARASYSMSKSGQMPKMFQKLSKNGVPVSGLIVSFIVSLLIFAFLDNWQEMAAFYAAAICLCNAVIPVTLYVLRKDFPNLPRPFKVFNYRIVSFLAFYISSMLLFWSGWNIMLKLSVIIVIGFFSLILIRKFSNQNFSFDLHGFSWLLFYMLSLGIVTYHGTYDGGSGIIKNGVDFILIAVICFISLVLATKFKLTKEKSNAAINKTMQELQNERKKYNNQQVA
ncbi:APC family permease [Pigmentibacter sp. JX0631]|uniref:APC family permease n=1 Tax=Pigmentibacter sp. JX0631 TaxID=2976982 RepID=UPI002468DBCA|nr:APC family permease [Pigmentibacter sp. JX0631]WGL59554.1 APC family permease [Pigmentibacter sp. JX0631]